MNGLEAARRLKTDADTRDIPIIAISASMIDGKHSPDVRHFDAVLLKPIDNKLLLSEVSKYLPHTLVEKAQEISGSGKNLNLKNTHIFDPKKLSPSIILEIEKQLYPTCKKLEGIIEMDDVYTLIKQSKQTGEKYALKELVDLSSQLQTHAEVFDIEQLCHIITSIRSDLEGIKTT